MCLLIIAWQRHEDYSITLAANRDERFDRPTQTFTVLRESSPRTLGGRDLLAGGTWLAVNEHGVVAGLTNTPSPKGPDPSKRSRGEVPLFLTSFESAASGIEAFIDQAVPGTYNSARVLVADRDHLFYLELSDARAFSVQELSPGLHVLENAPLGGESSKARFVTELLTDSLKSAEELWRTLPAVVSSHDAAPPTPPEITNMSGLSRWRSTRAPCVHTEGYGTCSSILLRVATDALRPPDVLVSDGPPCSAPFVDASEMWAGRSTA